MHFKHNKKRYIENYIKLRHHLEHFLVVTTTLFSRRLFFISNWGSYGSCAFIWIEFLRITFIFFHLMTKQFICCWQAFPMLATLKLWGLFLVDFSINSCLGLKAFLIIFLTIQLRFSYSFNELEMKYDIWFAFQIQKYFHVVSVSWSISIVLYGNI